MTQPQAAHNDIYHGINHPTTDQELSALMATFRNEVWRDYMEDSVRERGLEGMMPLINAHDDGIYRTLEILRFLHHQDVTPWVGHANISRHHWSRQLDCL
jgi:hypothetical protein